MDTVTIKKFTGKQYYNADELQIEQPVLFKGCRNSRAILNKKKIDEDNYIFVKIVDSKWRKSDGLSKKFDKLYLLKGWVDEQLKETEIIEDAPEVIALEDHEKFKDDDGNTLEIETRGERIANKCYFKLSDAAEGFGMKSLCKTICNDQLVYEKDVHYKYFYCIEIHNLGLATNKNTNKKTLFLTYRGLLRVLFVSRSGNADNFVTWATETLFTAQMGTTKEKRKLVSSLLSIPVADIKAVFSKTSCKLPVIYMFTLGIVKDLRKTFNIDEKHKDDNVVAKVGMSENLKRRATEHANNYGKLKNVSVELAQYEYIDPQYQSQAETDLLHILRNSGFILEHDTYKELIIFNKAQLSDIKKYYNMISRSYIGHISELVSKNKALENEILLIKGSLKIELMEEKAISQQHLISFINEKHEKELIQKDMELLKKDVEIMKLSKKHKK